MLNRKMPDRAALERRGQQSLCLRLLLLGVACIATSFVWAETPPTYQSECGLLSFSDFPSETLAVKKAPLVLERGTRAWEFRTVVRGAYKEGAINFNGRYVTFDIGCGLSCQFWVFIDASTGRVFVPEGVSSLGAEFRLDSRLFVINPPDPDIPLEPEFLEFSGPRYMLWKNNDLHPVCSPISVVPAPRNGRSFSNE